jgi:CheY-specific phosphatase CheX
MEKNHLLEAMKISISEVLETMFFLPIDRTEIVEIDTFHSALNENLELVEVEFAGIFSGSILLLIPDDLALFLTASFLGSIEEKVLPTHIDETKKEIVNMIAGNTLANFNDQVVFDLGIPDIVHARDIENRIERGDVVIYQSHTLENFLFIRLLLEN